GESVKGKATTGADLRIECFPTVCRERPTPAAHRTKALKHNTREAHGRTRRRSPPEARPDTHGTPGHRAR
ncbi:hypothetical protein, partial [Streptomyces sp. NPDC055105]|uniref:hypothetical protein n=1 Tax=Streptomyces sp. NPDC055105 TaxID=3365719 RepID=UPI0037CE7022